MEIGQEQVDLQEAARHVADEFRPGGELARLLAAGPGARPGRGPRGPKSSLTNHPYSHRQCHHPYAAGNERDGHRCARTKHAELIVGDDAKKGIDPRAIDKVFDRFYTGDAASGSGLGLAIADELALRMGGTLEVVSRRGHTAFTLSLPLSERRRRPREPAGAAA